MMQVGDPVTLTCASWSGVVDKVHQNGRVDIALDDGGKAWGMSQDEVREADKDDVREALHEDEPQERREQATADKSWPPKVETKVPDATGQK